MPFKAARASKGYVPDIRTEISCVSCSASLKHTITHPDKAPLKYICPPCSKKTWEERKSRLSVLWSAVGAAIDDLNAMYDKKAGEFAEVGIGRNVWIAAQLDVKAKILAMVKWRPADYSLMLSAFEKCFRLLGEIGENTFHVRHEVFCDCGCKRQVCFVDLPEGHPLNNGEVTVGHLTECAEKLPQPKPDFVGEAWNKIRAEEIAKAVKDGKMNRGEAALEFIKLIG